MPVFKYIGYDQAGAESEGVIEADGHRDAVLKIRTQGIFPKEVSESTASSKKILSKKLSPQILAGLTRQLSTLVSSGVPLVDAVRALSSEQKGEWRHILTDINDKLAGGSTLARAMEAHPSIFPDFYTGLVTAGENSGKLTEVLLKLADYLENDIKIKSKVKTALVYPAFMACVSVAIVIFLFIFVIPKITKIFEDTSTTLPFITIVLIWVSNTMKTYWWLLLASFAGVVLLYRRIKETKKELIDAVLLKDPTGILTGLYMLRFSMTMGFLLSGGLPILKAMQLSSKATGNTVLEQKIMTAQGHVSQGAKLSSSLEGFPPTLLQVISTGEQTGRLPEILMKTSESYESEFDRKLQRAVSVLEPALILAMGLIVGFIIVSVLLPIFELNEIMS